MFKFDEQFFTKHQKTLLYIANKWYLRWLLGLNRLPKELKNIKIDKITPNSIHSVIGKLNKNGRPKYKVNGYFFTGPRFAEALAHNLSPFCYFQNFSTGKMVWRFSPIGVLGCLLIALYPKIIGGFCFFGTTTTYKPSAASGQGMYSGDASSWSTARNASSALGLQNSFYSSVSGGYYYCIRAAFTIDTSGIGSGSTISSAYWSLVMAGDACGTAGEYYNLFDYSGANTVATDSFNDMTVDSPTAYTTAWQGSEVTDGTRFNTANWNSTGLGIISKTGSSKFSMRNHYDYNNSAPLGRKYMYFYQYANTTTDPYLSVTYTTAVANTTNFFQLF
jgi:hypothetical protein